MSYMSKTSASKQKTMSNVFNNSLLNIYINTVKTGSQEEIEQFSQIEKQKLVQLLSTNNELLTYIFDKMFKNMKKSDKGKALHSKTNRSREANNLQRSQADIFHALLNLEANDTNYEDGRQPPYENGTGFNKNSDQAVFQQKKLYTQNTTGDMIPNKNVIDGKTMKVNFEQNGPQAALAQYHLSASPLLLGEPKKSSLVGPNSFNHLGGAGGKIKDSGNNTHILSNIDTDYLQQ